MMAQSQPEKKKRKRKKLDAPKTKKKKTISASKDSDLGDMDADQFMASFGNDSDTNDKPDPPSKPKSKTKKKSKKCKLANTKESEQLSHEIPVESEVTSESASHEENIPKSGNVKKGLSRLEGKDSDFFKFLQENDPELLNFSGGEDSDESSGDDSEDDKSGEVSENTGENLENGDSASELEDENEEQSQESPDEKDDTENAVEDMDDVGAEEPEMSESTSIPVTSKLLKKWQSNLEKFSLPSWKQLVRAFQAAVVTAKGDEPESGMKYTIVDPDIVNRVIMLCLEHSSEVLQHHLGENPTSSNKWNRVKMSLKSYLNSLTELLGEFRDGINTYCNNYIVHHGQEICVNDS